MLKIPRVLRVWYLRNVVSRAPPPLPEMKIVRDVRTSCSNVTGRSPLNENLVRVRAFGFELVQSTPSNLSVETPPRIPSRFNVVFVLCVNLLLLRVSGGVVYSGPGRPG